VHGHARAAAHRDAVEQRYVRQAQAGDGGVQQVLALEEGHGCVQLPRSHLQRHVLDVAASAEGLHARCNTPAHRHARAGEWRAWLAGVPGR
jgi:hypothetical protein